MPLALQEFLPEMPKCAFCPQTTSRFEQSPAVPPVPVLTTLSVGEAPAIIVAATLLLPDALLVTLLLGPGGLL